MTHNNPEYLDLLEKTLLHWFWYEKTMDGVGRILDRFITEEERENGTCAWPVHALTMIGRRRLRNIRDLCQRVLDDEIPGGFAECGVWRGGACLYARACLPKDRTVYVCDSFKGFPENDPETNWKGITILQVPVEIVMRNFQNFGLTENVRFVEGWFDSIGITVGPLAVLRIDADSYKGTSEALRSLWPKLSPGGFCICDDYGILPEARRACHDFLPANLTVQRIDDSGVWWRKD